MAYTLADFSKTATDPLKKGVVDVFAKESMLMDMLSFETAGTLGVTLMRPSTLPSIVARNIGESFTESKGIIESLEEKVCLLGGYIDIPKELLKAKNNLIDQQAVQTKMFVTSMAYKFNDMFINGAPDDNVKEMVGVKYRLANDLPAAQSINGGGVDVSADSANVTTNSNTFVDLVDQVIHSCDGHSADVLLMNSTLYLRVLSMIRQLGLWATTKDRFGLDVPTWGPGGPRIHDLGAKADQTTKVITDTESATGVVGGGTLTSLYAVKFGEEYINAFQFQDLDIIDVGLLESGVSERTIIDWGVGIYMYNPRSISRIRNIQAA
jgi:hypothetical protein